MEPRREPDWPGCGHVSAAGPIACGEGGEAASGRGGEGWRGDAHPPRAALSFPRAGRRLPGRHAATVLGAPAQPGGLQGAAGIDGRWVLICFPSSAASPSPASLAACAPAFPLFPIWGLDGDESEGAPGLGTGGRTRVELPLHVESPPPKLLETGTGRRTPSLRPPEGASPVRVLI